MKTPTNPRRMSALFAHAASNFSSFEGCPHAPPLCSVLGPIAVSGEEYDTAHRWFNEVFHEDGGIYSWGWPFFTYEECLLSLLLMSEFTKP